MKKDQSHHKPSGLGTGNEDLEGCYAPVDKEGSVILVKKKHFKDNESHPDDWMPVPCNHH